MQTISIFRHSWICRSSSLGVMRGNYFRWPNKLDCVRRKCFIGRHPSTCHAIHKLVAAIAMGERIQWKLFILREILRRVNYIDQFLIANKLECRKRKQQRRCEWLLRKHCRRRRRRRSGKKIVWDKFSFHLTRVERMIWALVVNGRRSCTTHNTLLIGQQWTHNDERRYVNRRERKKANRCGRRSILKYATRTRTRGTPHTRTPTTSKIMSLTHQRSVLITYLCPK